jgi:hypothetical protein
MLLVTATRYTQDPVGPLHWKQIIVFLKNLPIILCSSYLLSLVSCLPSPIAHVSAFWLSCLDSCVKIINKRSLIVSLWHYVTLPSLTNAALLMGIFSIQLGFPCHVEIPNLEYHHIS